MKERRKHNIIKKFFLSLRFLLCFICKEKQGKQGRNTMKQRRKQCNKEGAGEATAQRRKHNETKKETQCNKEGEGEATEQKRKHNETKRKHNETKKETPCNK